MHSPFTKFTELRDFLIYRIIAPFLSSDVKGDHFSLEEYS